MTKSHLRLLAVFSVYAATAILVLAQPPAAPATHHDPSVAQAKKDDGQFVKRHDSFLERAKSGPIGLLFLGDSITDNWSKAPEIWNKYYGQYEPANFGIGGDTTQNVIWRIDQGELDGIHPRVVVLMIGTNNTGTDSASAIFAADRKIVQLIREKIPGTKVLVLAIFPRGARKNRDGTIDPGTKRMEAIREVNRSLATLDDGKNVRFLDIGAGFLDANGKIPDAIMPDQLHPSVAGYQIWADAMQPLLQEMLK